MASERRGFYRRYGGEIGPDGLYCAGCQAEETSAQLLDDMMRQRDAEVAENARLRALLAERDAAVARAERAESALVAYADLIDYKPFMEFERAFNSIIDNESAPSEPDERDKGLMSRTTHGSRHVYACNRGLYLAPGQHATGGAPCSERCVQAHDALRLGAVFLQAVIDEYGSLPAGGDTPETEQLRLLEAV